MRIPGVRSTVTLVVRGPRPADEVWERYAVPSLWPTWSPQIRTVTLDHSDGYAQPVTDTHGSDVPDRIIAGLTGRVWTYAPIPANFRVDAVDEQARIWSWTVRVGPVTVHLVHGVQAGALKTATTLTLTGLTPVVYAYAPIAQLALRRLVS